MAPVVPTIDLTWVCSSTYGFCICCIRILWSHRVNLMILLLLYKQNLRSQTQSYSTERKSFHKNHSRTK